MSELLTKVGIAAVLKLKPRTVDEWMARGWIPYLKIGRAVRFNRAEVLDHLNAKFQAAENVKCR